MTKAEEIYHRFVRYEWEEVSDTMKKSILEAINEALRQQPISDSLPSDKEISHAADKWIFDENGKRWSNNDASAGDNYGSFMAGAKWMRSKLNVVNDVLKSKRK